MCLPNWQKITSDPWVLQVVQGYQIEWMREPCQLMPAITAVSLLADQEGNPGLVSEASSGGEPTLQGPVYKLPIPGKEEGWLPSTSHQFETAEWLCTKATFQDGRLGMVRDLLQSDDWGVPWISRTCTIQ